MDEMLDHNVQAGLKGRKAWYTQGDKREFKGLELQEVESVICTQGYERARGKKVGLQSEILEGKNSGGKVELVMKGSMAC